MYRKLAYLLFAVSLSALAFTAAERSTLKSQVDALIDALPVDAGPPPVVTPPTTWPRFKPDVLDIDLVNYSSVMKAKWLDGNKGYDGAGTAIHYGKLAGNYNIVNNPDGTQTVTYPEKFSNPTCPPQFLTDPTANNLHFLRSCTDGTGQIYNGSSCPTCRLIFWNFDELTPRLEYYIRYMIRVGSDTLANQTDLGIKSAGLNGEELELGPKTTTGWPLQTYRYDFESGAGYGVVELTGFDMVPLRWYVIEEHVKVNTVAQGIYNSDGVIEVWVDGKSVWSRTNIKMFNSGTPMVNGLLVQSYHGGLKPPKGKITIDHARIAICTSRCGPPSEVGP